MTDRTPQPVYPVADRMHAWITAAMRQKGRDKYPTELMTYSCGDPLLHALEENKDEQHYLTAAWMEREADRAEIARLRAEIEAKDRRIEQLKREVCRLSLRVPS